MINANDILQATNGGLDIILYYYPQARDSVENTRKPFVLRNEKTPSAFLKQFGNQWKVTDFGDDAQARSCFDITMQEEGVKFYEAVCILADRYNISNTINSNINKPEIRQRPANENEPSGHFAYEFKKQWTDQELILFGHRVKQEHVDKLAYRSLVWYSSTKKNKSGELETTTILSTDTYPIFARECSYKKADGTDQTFLKVYQPLNSDKAFRFFYNGSKPKDYVNGLNELRRAFTEYNERERQIFESNPANDGRVYSEKKLEAAVLCSGERDAVNCLSYGYQPLWLNSESATLTEYDYKEVLKYAERLYNIPDIDSTGKRKGIELGMKYLSIHTVKIPEWLGTYKDMRGKPRKDLRDYLDLRRERKDFEDLIKRAMPYQFWEYVKKREGKEGREVKSLEINTAYMLNFLTDCGFGKIQDSITKKETLVHVDGSVVKEVTGKDVRGYLIKFVKERESDIDVVNLLLNSKRTSTITMDDLNKIKIDFSDNSENQQFMFFSNKTIEITPDQIIEHQPGTSGRFVWDHKISEHKFRRIEPSFSITRDSEDNFHLDIKHLKSHYFRYLLNASRIHWRDEFELLSTGNPETEEKYLKNNHFNISGPRLNFDQVQEQKDNLLNKIFAIGYMMHRYKALSKSWALWVMEDKLSDDGQSLGGTGKSFFIKFLKNFKKIVTFGGRNKKLTDNQHIFERIDKSTDLMLIDDADQYLDFNFFYGPITGDMEKNEKHVKSQELTYEESPKLAITSNHTPQSNDSSTSRRLLFVLFSDWYHEKNEDNDYRETRTIHDDFGYDICKRGYKEEYWNEDINFLADCIQFYLSICSENIKLNPPMKKAYQRMYISTMGNQFRDWAEVYFSINSVNVDKPIIRSRAMEDFSRDTNMKTWSTKKFTKAMHAFSNHAIWVYELNPKELRNSDGRLVKNIDGKTQELIYIRTYDPVTCEPRKINQELPF